MILMRSINHRMEGAMLGTFFSTCCPPSNFWIPCIQFWRAATYADSLGDQSVAEDGIVSFISLIALLDVDFHSLPSNQHWQQHGPVVSGIDIFALVGSNE